MKRFCFFLLFAMTAVLSAAAKPAATPTAATTKPAATSTAVAKPAETAKPAAAAAAKPATATAAKPAGSVLTSIYSASREPSEFADREKAADLISRRAELAQKIQNERKRILKEDAKAKELYDEIMRLNRQLASLLEAKKSMIELNSELLELDSAISKLKPAPAAETETKDTEKEDAGKADNEDKTGKAGKE